MSTSKHQPTTLEKMHNSAFDALGGVGAIPIVACNCGVDVRLLPASVGFGWWIIFGDMFYFRDE